MKAAAKSYFGKPLEDLTLAQYAILAAIPQSPTRFDLVRNAEEVCLDEVEEGAEAAADAETVDCKEVQLVVPDTSEIVQRRNYVLDLMKTRSPLTGTKHRPAEYEAAKHEPVVLAKQVSATWRAPHFVWQVREALAAIVCPDNPTIAPRSTRAGTASRRASTGTCRRSRRSGSTSRPGRRNPRTPARSSSRRRSREREYGWILNLKGRNLHNAAAAVIDYRTGEVLAYAGSASYTSKGTKKFQPQFDVLSDGWRQPGSSIKPIDYAIGIEDEVLTASTMFMDVVTDFGGKFTPTQADKLERGPVRLRSALQFSLNIPAIKATIIRASITPSSVPRTSGWPTRTRRLRSSRWASARSRPTRSTCSARYGTIANGGVRMPRQMIMKVVDEDGKQIWPLDNDKPEGVEVISPQAAYIITDILAGNTE